MEAFAEFVRENVNQFEALRILLKRPQDWNPEVLGKLRHDLRANDYDEKRLRTAHEKVYRKQLADVISMIKHAADQQAPLLTAQERVTKAVEELQAFHSFTPEQQKWLGFIAEHLKENLSISEQDLEFQPVFAQRGGLARARKLFGKELKPLIERSRTGKFTPDDLAGGTFSITNLGAFGIDVFDPIIVTGQAAILGVGRIADKPVVINKEIVVRSMMNLCLSFDHRLLDGAHAARFLQRLKELLETPLLIIV